MKAPVRMVGFGDNAGSGFPAILKTWADNNWIVPELMESNNNSGRIVNEKGRIDPFRYCTQLLEVKNLFSMKP